eukprot:NODE_4694_length_773_cov_49.285912_g3904_i0.p1 GENE.NODE_4694_length_773_cov_49.285912_g3904_i0~~NODE_4694_length_773_cov_49.285912_g3904_i0.p1  ORF type:complete len:233 (+),score=53.91 NODE_4694_length_773_cov_49.285912_g3904_i0:55-699(+)
MTLQVVRDILLFIFGVLAIIFIFFPIMTGKVWPHFDELYYIFASTSPWLYGGLGVGMGMGFSIIGAGWGIFITGSSLAGATVQAPRISAKNLISIIFCEAVAIYGIILSIIMAGKLEPGKSGLWRSNLPVLSDYNMYAAARRVGYIIFCAGVTVGFGNLACGLSVGIVGSTCAIADAHKAELFVKILVIEIFASALGIFTIIIGIIQANSAVFS